LFFEGDMFIN
jgi:hypothetical protein